MEDDNVEGEDLFPLEYHFYMFVGAVEERRLIDSLIGSWPATVAPPAEEVHAACVMTDQCNLKSTTAVLRFTSEQLNYLSINPKCFSHRAHPWVWRGPVEQRLHAAQRGALRRHDEQPLGNPQQCRLPHLLPPLITPLTPPPPPTNTWLFYDRVVSITLMI